MIRRCIIRHTLSKHLNYVTYAVSLQKIVKNPAKGYAVSIVGLEEGQVRKYIHDQEGCDNRRGNGRF